MSLRGKHPLQRTQLSFPALRKDKMHNYRGSLVVRVLREGERVGGGGARG